MIQAIIMTEIFKIVVLLLMKVALTKAGFLGNRFDGGNKRVKNTINALFGESPITHTPTPQSDEATSALVVGLIQLICTALGCLIVKHMCNSIVQSVKTIAIDGNLPSISTNITQYLAPNTTLNSYEIQIAESAVILPSDITFQFEGIGGLTYVKNSLEELAEDFIEIRKHEGTLLQPIAGVLLHGPPGCGKTALAKSFGKRTNVPMLSISPSSLLRKYVGETSQLLKAVFSLARKLSPCVIFVDEMDSLLRTRSDDDHVVQRNIGTEFMQLWDDLITSKERVMVIAATNRPEDIDPAVRRRFERSFLIALPDAAARSEIFKKVLDSTQTDGGIDYAYCAENSDGFCSSDIVAVCKAAMAISVHERRAALKKALLAGTTNSTASGNQLAFRPLTMEDIKATMTGFQPTSRLPPKTSSSSSKGFGTPGKSNSDVLPPSEPKAGGGFGMTNRPFPGSNQFDDAYGSESDETFDDEDDEDEL